MKKRGARRLAVAALMMPWATSASAGEERALSGAACAAVEDAGPRLACYDKVFRRAEAAPSAGALGHAQLPNAPPAAADKQKAPRAPPKTGDYFDVVWGLGRHEPIPLTTLTPHRPSYVLARTGDGPNDDPRSPTRGSAFPAARDDDQEELKFQLSFKSELISPRRFRNGVERLNDVLPESLRIADDSFLAYSRVWVAFTQQSNWQVLNSGESRPFRETNYEPEIIWTYENPRYASSAWKLLNVGLSHHSNGRGGAQSRSWNRSYVQGAWGLDGGPGIGSVSVLARKWWRIPENGIDDDNPDIKRYYGRGDVVLRWEPHERHRLALLLRHNLRVNPSRGFAQLDYSYLHKKDGLPLHFQVSSGYGESLIDYNHNQLTFGIGVSFGKW